MATGFYLLDDLPGGRKYAAAFKRHHDDPSKKPKEKDSDYRQAIGLLVKDLGKLVELLEFDDSNRISVASYEPLNRYMRNKYQLAAYASRRDYSA